MNHANRILLLSVMQLAVFRACAADEAESPQPLRPAQQTALRDIDARSGELKQINRDIWQWAEVGLQEHRSSERLMGVLSDAGFDVTRGLSHMPTAFVASYGSGRPVIGILAEYDALPGMSQQVADYRIPAEAGKPGHACGHSGLGTAAVGAALAVKAALAEHELTGTIRLYGTPAEETAIGKVYMVLDRQFRDLDVCLHWHPASLNAVWSGSSKALVSAKFTFRGTAAHAAASPESGRSALDAVELMNVGVNYMREHVKEDARFHYVVTNGGGAPNVVPAEACVWYFVRADRHEDVDQYFQWVKQIAQGAALMTRTKVDVAIDTDCHELIPNTPLSELLFANLLAVGPPAFSQEEHAFARRLQQPLIDEFGTAFPVSLDESVHPLHESSNPTKGSTDVGDVSWHVPTGGIRTSCFIARSPGHSWQNVACIGSSIGEKGIQYAAKVLAVSAMDLIERPELVSAARSDFESRLKDRTYTTLIPEGQRPPQSIR